MAEETDDESTLEFHLDCFLNGTMMGWVRDAAHPHKAVDLQLCLGRRVISAHRADRYRPDLEAEGLGSGRYGFEIKVPAAALATAESEGEPLAVVAAGDPDIILSSLDLKAGLDVPGPLRNVFTDRLDASEFAAAPASAPRDQAAPSASRSSYLALVAGEMPKGCDGPSLFPYAEHVRLTQTLPGAFSPALISSDFDHFIRWYLDHYNVSRAPRRAPLSRDVIAWLNEPVVLGGMPFTATRVMLWYLAIRPEGDGLRSLSDETSYRRLAYWWAGDRAPALNAEDCLVPQSLIDYLRAVPSASRDQPFPLSRFMEEALVSRPGLDCFGPMHSVSARVTAYMALMIEALDEPGLLRFVPHAVRSRFFDREAPLFDDLAAAACAGRPDAQPMKAEGYRALIEQRGFAFDSRAFTSVDRAGHRSEAARLGGVPAMPQADVQLIGPFNKISGIAHATRLSRRILEHTGLAVVSSDCSLDNPQPEEGTPLAGTPLSAEGSSMTAARVNLIHLNAEMLPLAFAYLPDVHAGAYTIGFFFWELDRPAECHRLALELVDEVWVSSEYNRRCFAAWTDKPVVNVGMALDLADGPPSSEARDGLLRLCKADQDAFVVLTTFDSLSYVSRKNPLGAVRAFGEAFAGDAKARLIVKTHNASSILDGFGRRVWGEVLRSAAADPRIIVIDETLPYADVMALKAGSDCYLSLHRSEGFGFGMLEAMRLGVPVVCTAYSGNLDFCDEATAWLVGADEIGVRPDEYAHVSPGHRWAEPRHDEAVSALRGVKDDPALAKDRAAAARARATDHYGIAAATKRYSDRLDAILALRPPHAAAPGAWERDLQKVAPTLSTENPGERRSLFGRLRGA